jgi:hypothetical protein
MKNAFSWTGVVLLFFSITTLVLSKGADGAIGGALLGVCGIGFLFVDQTLDERVHEPNNIDIKNEIDYDYMNICSHCCKPSTEQDPLPYKLGPYKSGIYRFFCSSDCLDAHKRIMSGDYSRGDGENNV